MLRQTPELLSHTIGFDCPPKVSDVHVVVKLREMACKFE